MLLSDELPYECVWVDDACVLVVFSGLCASVSRTGFIKHQGVTVELNELGFDSSHGNASSASSLYWAGGAQCNIVGNLDGQ